VSLPTLTRHLTDDPVPVTLALMAKGARAASKTWTIQEWAGSLAAKAGPRDYVGQLRELYNGVISRWRYVMEAGERVPESPRAILGYVLGAEYNKGPHCKTPEHCDLSKTEWKAMGWGDCDDVSTLIAAAVLSLGMEPLWRVAQWPGGGHVSVATRTPKGEWVSIDPVGHPDNQFGWAMEPDGGQVTYFNLDGQQVNGPSGQFAANGNSAMGSVAYSEQVGPYLSGPQGAPAQDMGPTYMLSTRGIPMQRVAQGHVALVRPGDTRGRRILTLPRYHARIFARGLASERAPAYDQFGEAYEYLGGLDCWAPMGRWKYDGANDDRYSKYLSGLGRRRTRRRRARAERRKKRRRRDRKFFKRVGKAFRKVFKFSTKVAARILQSRAAKGTIGGILGVFGVPQGVVDRIFNGAARALRESGKSTKFIRYLVTGRWKQAAKIAHKVAKAFARGAAGSTVPGFAGGDCECPDWEFQKGDLPTGKIGREVWGMWDQDQDDRENDRHWAMRAHNGRTYAVAPVMGLRMGEPNEVGDIATQVVLPSPTPGGFYRIKKGDTPLGIAGQAYNLKAGGQRTAALKRINAIKYNAPFLRPTKGSFEQKYIGTHVISTLARYALEPAAQAAGGKGNNRAVIWIPQVDEEPPEDKPEPVLPTVDDDDPPIEIPPELPPSDEDMDISLPPLPTEPCKAGTVYKLTDDGWVCVADPYFIPGVPTPPHLEPTPPDPEPDDEEKPQIAEPPTPGLDPSKLPKPGDPIPGGRIPLCPPGLEAYWPSGNEGFGPHECYVPGYVPPGVEPGDEPAPAPKKGGGGLALAAGLMLTMLMA